MPRSEFEPGSTRWAVRRTQWRAMGIPDEDFHKPKVAVVNSSSTLSVCYIHLDQVSQVVQEAVREAADLPFEIHTAAPSDLSSSLSTKIRSAPGRPSGHHRLLPGSADGSRSIPGWSSRSRRRRR